MIELHKKIKEAFIKINFIKRYEELFQRFNAEKTPSSKRLIYIDGEEVMETIQTLGYSPQFDAREKFYKIKEEKIGEYTFGVHIILRDGMVEKPIFATYEDLDGILKISFDMYEDFKKAFFT